MISLKTSHAIDRWRERVGQDTDLVSFLHQVDVDSDAVVADWGERQIIVVKYKNRFWKVVLEGRQWVVTILFELPAEQGRRLWEAAKKLGRKKS